MGMIDGVVYQNKKQVRQNDSSVVFNINLSFQVYLSEHIIEYKLHLNPG